MAPSRADDPQFAASSSTEPWKYDVFLSFRGPESSRNFRNQLHEALIRTGVKVSLDDELMRGETADHNSSIYGHDDGSGNSSSNNNILDSSLLKGMVEASRISLIILSREYADSSRCLDELKKIMECKRGMGQMVIPIVYDVDPSEETYRWGFGEAFLNPVHIRQHSTGQAQRCGDGWDLTNNGSETEVIMSIAQLVKPVGIESRVEDLGGYLHIGIDDVRYIGIYGVGGIGKTTVAKAVYNSYQGYFDCASFLGNVKESTKEPNGLLRLKKQFVRDVLKTTETNVETISAGVHQIIRNKKILVVLDDVDDKQQLDQLAIYLDWFCPGSRILVTTREEGLLKELDVATTYLPQLMNFEDAIKLFSWHAFGKSSPDEEYYDLSRMVVSYCRGLPRTIVATACFLSGKSTTEWRDILNIYVAREDNILKILCGYCSLFPRGFEYDKNELIKIWMAEGFIENRQGVKMEDVGIACFNSLENKGFFVRSREDSTLDYDSVSSTVCNPKALYKVKPDVDVSDPLLAHSPRDVEAADSVPEILSWANYIRDLDGPQVRFLEDKVSPDANFREDAAVVTTSTTTSSDHDRNPKTIIDMVSVPRNRVFLPDYFRAVDARLDKAPTATRHLSLISRDINDKSFRVIHKLKELRSLLLLSGSGSSITFVPRNFFWSLKSLRTLKLSGTLISELPSSIRNLKDLRYLDLSHSLIKQLPDSTASLHQLQTLKLRGCMNLNQLPEDLKKLTELRHLELDIARQLDSLPPNLGNLTKLQTLSAFVVGRDDGFGIGELKNLNNLRGAFSISKLENVTTVQEAKKAVLTDKTGIQRLDLRWSTASSDHAETQETILEYLRPHSDLKELRIQSYGGSQLPTWISNPSFANLAALTLYRCKNFVFLPAIGQLPGLKVLSIVEVNKVKEINDQFFRDGLVDVKEFHAFPKLERLEVDTMHSLKRWTEVPEGDLPFLLRLTVDSCSKLAALPSLSSLKSLKHLELKRCPKLLPGDGLPDSLESLMIIDCPKIKEWFLGEDGEEWNRCSLRSIWIDHEEINVEG